MSLADNILSDLEGLFYSSSEFGVEASIGGHAVLGIYDAPSSEALGVGGTKPVFRCATARVTQYSIAQGSAVIIGGVTYKVVSVEPDGTGETVLGLRESA